MLRNFGGVRHAVGLLAFLLLREVGNFVLSFHMISVRGRTLRVMPKGGLEPPRIAPLDPKSSASTNSATSALASSKIATAFDRIKAIELRPAAEKREAPANCAGASLWPTKTFCYLPTCRLTILGACVASTSEKTFRLTYSPSFKRPSACWRSVAVLMTRAGAG